MRGGFGANLTGLFGRWRCRSRWTKAVVREDEDTDLYKQRRDQGGGEQASRDRIVEESAEMHVSLDTSRTAALAVVKSPMGNAGHGQIVLSISSNRTVQENWVDQYFDHFLAAERPPESGLR